MKSPSWLSPAAVLVNLAPRVLSVRHAGQIHEWPLERTPGGSLTEPCRTRIRAELPAALDRKPWSPRQEARCALPAAGVTLRRWKFPRAADEELHRVIQLQIEGEFPLPPEELAWGWIRLGESNGPQEVLVAAVKRTIVAGYADLLGACGLEPSFTLGALARAALAPAESGAGSMLDLGPDRSEWLMADALGPLRLRVLPWGEHSIIRELNARTGPGADGGAAAFAQILEARDADAAPMLGPALEAALDALVASAPPAALGPRLRLTGRLAASPLFTAALTRRLGTGATCESLEPDPASAASATLRGLARQTQGHGTGPWLLLRTQPAEAAAVPGPSAPRRWIVAAALLLLALLTLPYAEALLLKPRLAARVAAIKARQDRLDLLDRQSDFLRHLRQNQAPCLETLLVLARTAPPGTRFDAFQLNRRGELSLRLTVRQPEEVTGFRSQLADCGFFSTVVVEEQNPTPDRQKVLVRMSAQVKPPNERQGLKILSADASPPAAGAPSPRR